MKTTTDDLEKGSVNTMKFDAPMVKMNKGQRQVAEPRWMEGKSKKGVPSSKSKGTSHVSEGMKY